MLQIGTGSLFQFAGAIGIVFLLYLVRAHGIAPFATLLAFDAGMNLAGVVVLRAVSDLAIAALLYLGIVQWQRIFGGRPAGRVGRWLVGVREQVGRGNVFVNFIAANYFLNTYVVFGTVATLPQARRRAFAGALIGDLASFIIDLAAILGLSALIGGSRATLTLTITGATLAFAVANQLLHRRFAAATA
ncbi:MAG: hypothetical protein U0841_26850 [Chloroflexia bacterium]